MSTSLSVVADGSLSCASSHDEAFRDFERTRTPVIMRQYARGMDPRLSVFGIGVVRVEHTEVYTAGGRRLGDPDHTRPK